MKRNHEPRFLVDFMLGRLAKWLRIFGYDTVYLNEKSRTNIVLQSLKENRVLVTRDHRLSRKRAYRLVLINSDDVAGQLRQLAQEGEITLTCERFFSRCTVCNAALVGVERKEEVRDLVPEYVYTTQDTFVRCPGCGKVYWSGTHRELLLRDLQKAGLKLCNENHKNSSTKTQ